MSILTEPQGMRFLKIISRFGRLSTFAVKKMYDVNNNNNNNDNNINNYIFYLFSRVRVLLVIL